jgi:hypothetical protein
MARLKILFADDQIPDESFPDQGLAERLREQYPRAKQGFLNACIKMRRVVDSLRVAGHDVRIGRTHTETLELIKSSHFDIAIVDIGWFGDHSIPRAQRRYNGWQICDAIEEANSRSGRRTLQIIFSNRFNKEPALSTDAARRGALPLFKSYNAAGRHALKAAIAFVESLVAAPTDQVRFAAAAANDLQEIMLSSLKEPLEQYRRWCTLTICMVGCSMALVLIGAAVALFGYVTAGVLSSVCSLLSNMVALVLYRQLKLAREDVKRTRQDVVKAFDKAVERFLSPAEDGARRVKPPRKNSTADRPDA